jgi:hypothetical protein
MDLISSSYYNQDSDEKNMNLLDSKKEAPFYSLRETPGNSKIVSFKINNNFLMLFS